MLPCVKELHDTMGCSAIDQKWINDGKTLSAVAKKKPGPRSQIPSEIPAWVYPKLVRKGQAFVKKHLMSVIFAHLVAFLFLLCYVPVRKVLLATGRTQSKTKAKLR